MTLFLLFAVITLVIISSFFSGSETSMMALNRYRLHHLAKKSRAAKRAETLLSRPDRLLSVILIGNTFANILASALATILAQRIFGDFGVAVATIVLTLFILLFAEVLPKTMAAIRPETFAFPATWILKILLKVLHPLICALSGFTNCTLKLFGMSIADKKAVDPLTADELRSVVHASRDSLAGQHKNMLLGVLDLEKETVQDAMLPRQNIHGIDLNDSWDEVINQIKTSPFSKLPVWRDSIDHVVGIFHLRKVIALAEHLKNPAPDLLETLLDPPYFIPETTSLQRQLLNFQAHSEHMALVVDEYGDIQGLVTVEDILEEVVGEFTNLSQPSAHTSTRKLKNGAIVVDGAMTVRDLNRDLGLSLPTEGPRTLSGLIVEHLESMPVGGLSLKIADYPIEVIKVDDNAVRTAKIYPKLISQGGNDE